MGIHLRSLEQLDVQGILVFASFFDFVEEMLVTGFCTVDLLLHLGYFRVMFLFEGFKSLIIHFLGRVVYHGDILLHLAQGLFGHFFSQIFSSWVNIIPTYVTKTQFIWLLVRFTKFRIAIFVDLRFKKLLDNWLIVSLVSEIAPGP